MVKKYIAVFAVAVLASLTLTAGAATAAPAAKTIEGKTVSFAAGKLKVVKKKKTTTYIVNNATDCGYSTGQMGNSMPCSKLKKSKYMNKSVTVTWHTKGGRRVAELVAVHL